jgi:hypothetical protein
VPPSPLLGSSRFFLCVSIYSTCRSFLGAALGGFVRGCFLALLFIIILSLCVLFLGCSCLLFLAAGSRYGRTCPIRRPCVLVTSAYHLSCTCRPVRHSGWCLFLFHWFSSLLLIFRRSLCLVHYISSRLRLFLLTRSSHACGANIFSFGNAD